MELRRGQALGERQLVDRLNDLGYAERPGPERPGEFAVADNTVTLRAAQRRRSPGKAVRATFSKPPVASSPAPRRRRPASIAWSGSRSSAAAPRESR